MGTLVGHGAVHQVEDLLAQRFGFDVRLLAALGFLASLLAAAGGQNATQNE